MQPMKFGIGQSVKRVEDVRLVSGRGFYSTDAADTAALRAVFLRSPYGHAKFSISDIDAVRSMPGVRGVFLAADFAELGGLPCLAPVDNSDKSRTPLKPFPVMSGETVQHVGDIIAMVVADSALEARDAVEAIQVRWDELPAVVESEDAIKPGAPVVFPGAPGNVAYDTHIGDIEKTNAAFATAPHRVRIKIVNPRVVANFMEPRSAVGEYDAESGRLTLHASSQGVHNIRNVVANAILKISPEKLRVVTQDVGGGFGTKSFVYREYPLVLEAARRLGRSVSWTADRTEHFLGDAQGRDNITTAEMALDANGRFLAMRVDILGNLGAYLHLFAPYIPWLGASMATGPYHIDTLHARVRGVYTHSVPVDAYRGAGRPEAAYVLERLVDACARELGMAPEKIRALNFVKPEQMPYHTVTDRDYDVGDFEGAMRACLAKADYANFAARAEAARKRGAIRGFGISSYIECTAWGDGEEGSVKLEKDGQFTVLIGTQSNGQGHETAYAQVVSQHLDVPLDRIKVVQGDTDIIPSGNGTGGSRSIPVGAVMVTRASQKLAASLKELAADKLEAAVADLEIADGKIRIAGTDRAITYAELAALPSATPEKVKAIEIFRAAQRDLSERHARLRGRDRPRDRRDANRSLHHRRRLRLHTESAAAGGAGAWRRRARRRAGLARARGIRPQWSIAHCELHGLRHAARGQSARVRIRNPQCSVHHESARPQGRGRSGLDRIDAGRNERGGGRLVAGLPGQTYRHAGDAVRGVRRDKAIRRSGVKAGFASRGKPRAGFKLLAAFRY